MDRKKLLWVIVAIIVVAAIIVIARRQRVPPPPGQKTVNVAMNVPITGTFGIYGQTIRDGALMAQSDLAGQGLDIRLNLDIQDNAGVPATATTILQKQALSQTDVYVSGVKPQTMAIFDRVNEKKWPYFVWIFDAHIVGQHPNTFRTWVNYKYEPEKYFQFINNRQAKKVAIACVNFPHTVQEFNEIVIPRLNSQGVQTNIEIYEFDTKQYRDLILKLNAQKPDLFILNGFQENLVGLVKALHTYNLVKDGNVIGTYDLLDASKILSKEELEGLRVVVPEFNIASTPKLNEWKQKFKSKYGREPLYTDAYSYDMIQIIADSAKRLSLPATSDQWIKALRETNIEGITGRLVFDQDKDQKLELRVGQYKGGTLILDPSEGAR
ncbi:MAG TPA: ABC transporter substrate-binding protein [Pyrinomonadaceae bacterium]|nr:ABC transporter substrate-binding protein [Pyrinomonadaceae bacterium]